MFSRAESYAKETWMYLNLFFHERGGRPMCDYFAEEKRKAEQQKLLQAAENGVGQTPAATTAATTVGAS
jgi:hypothetical protein